MGFMVLCTSPLPCSRPQDPSTFVQERERYAIYDCLYGGEKGDGMGRCIQIWYGTVRRGLLEVASSRQAFVQRTTDVRHTRRPAALRSGSCLYCRSWLDLFLPLGPRVVLVVVRDLHTWDKS